MSEDGETLDNEELKTWSDLVIAHNRQTVIKLTLLKLTNQFEPTSYKFPASTQLILSLRVSRALIY